MRASTVHPLVLAAGASSRMGRPKAGLPFGDRTALGLILEACDEAGLAPGVVVAGAHPAEVRAALGSAQGQVVDNPRWAEGRATSIQVGLATLPADAGGFLLWPVDVCLPGAAAVGELLEAARDHPAYQAWVPSFAGRRGHPILFAACVAERLRALRADQPARDVTRALHEEGALYHRPTKLAAVRMTMNTPPEYERWLQEFQRGSASR